MAYLIQIMIAMLMHTYRLVDKILFKFFMSVITWFHEEVDIFSVNCSLELLFVR